MRDFGAASIMAVLTCSSCVQPPAQSANDASKADPATQAEAEAQPGSAIVTITGPVAFIDGKRVARVGHPTKVAPGCHVVRTDTNFVTSNNQVTVWGTISPVDFVLPTREGYNYYIERQILDTSGNSSPVRFTAYERETSGKVVQTFAPTGDAAAIHACNANAPAPVEAQ